MIDESLKNYGLSDLSTYEQQKIEGGNPWVAFVIGYVVIEIVTNPVAHWNAFVRGVEKGMNIE